MSESLQINASARTELGKAEMRRMRHQGRIPGVVYGAGKEAVSLTTSHNDLMLKLAEEAFSASILTLNLDGKEEQVVLKELQRHPYKPRLLHLDLLRVSQTSKLVMTVPLHFINEDTAPGVKVDGGLVSHTMSEVEIACLPADLPEFLTVDLGSLEEGQALHLSDVQLPEGVEIPALALGAGHDLPVVSIHKPRAEEVSQDEGEAAGEGEAEGDAEES